MKNASWDGSRTSVCRSPLRFRWLGRTGFVFVIVALAVGTRLVAQQGAQPQGRASVVSDGLTGADAGLVTAYAQASVVQMQAFQQANPNFQQFKGPDTKTPPPQAVDENGVVVVARSGTPLPVSGAAPPRPGLQAGSVGGAPAPLLNQSFQGVVDNLTFIPPDTMGAVGPNHVVEFLNTGFTVFDRSGAVLSPQVSIQAFWSSLGAGAGQPAASPFDPKIAYDQYTGRWVVVSDSSDNAGAWVLVGVSRTGDPTGLWNLFGIPANVNDGVFNHTGEFADFPGMGLDLNNIVITNNMFSVAGGNFVHADVWVIAKTALMAAGGTLVQGVDFTVMHNPCGTFGFTFQPCHTFGQTAATTVNYIIDQGWLDNATRMLRLLRIKRISGTGAGATMACAGGNDFVEVAQYNLNKLSGPQPSCPTPIDTGDGRMLNAVVRNGKIWATHGVGIGTGITDSAPPSRAQVAWYEIDPSVAGAFPGGVPNQQGHVSDPALYYAYPSIAVNKDECVALAFSGMNETTFAGSYYTARFPTDSPGAMRTVAHLHAGQGHYDKRFGGPRNRWGDYSAMMVDPVDDQTFWTVQEYAEVPSGSLTSCGTNTGRWATWWGAFRCAQGLAPAFTQPPSANGENIASNIDWVDNIPNIAVADDFISDGRPITGARWWGGKLETPSTCPEPDGWFVSFHEPIDPVALASPALGLYYCDTTVVQQLSVVPTTCTNVPVSEHMVDLAQCCLVHTGVDSRTGLMPATAGSFVTGECLDYGIDIQAVFGHRFVDVGGVCVEELTGTAPVADCWGWHTTTISNGDTLGLGPALSTSVSMSGGEWFFGPWDAVVPVCAVPSMAFELLTNVAGGPADNNGNGIADLCEGCLCTGDINNNGTIEAGADITAIFDCIGGDCSGCVNTCDVNCDGTVDDIDVAAALCRLNGGLFDTCCGACPLSLAPDPVTPIKSRYASFSARNAGRATALRVTLTQSTPFPSAVGATWWVQAPTAISEASGTIDPAAAPGFASFQGASLGCSPVCADWGAMGEIHLFDRNIVSSSAYEIEVVDCTCDLNAQQSFSLPLSIPIARFGDVCGPGSGGACSTPPNAIISVLNDVVGTLDKFRNAPGAPSKTRTDINPEQPDSKIGIVDVTRGLDAFSGSGYPFSEPVGCPATGPRP